MKNNPNNLDKDESKFLQDQLQWIKDRDRILEKIENKLYEMRVIAYHSMNPDLSSTKRENLNNQLNTLKKEVHILEKQLHSVVH